MVSHPIQGFDGEAHKDEETLRHCYHDLGMSLSDIASEVEMTSGGVNYWMEKHGIAKREPCPRRTGCRYLTDSRGREKWTTKVRYDAGVTDHTVFVHRLVMVAEHGLDALRGKVVHHRNHIPWDNCPDNLELLTHEQHRAHHAYVEAFGSIPARK